MQKTLDQFAIGEQGAVRSVGGEGRIKRRLFDMGITPGVEIMLRKRAPLGDPIEITLRGLTDLAYIRGAACYNGGASVNNEKICISRKSKLWKNDFVQ